MSYLIEIKKATKSNYQIVLYHGKFFEKLGSYNLFINKMGVKFVFIDIDRVIFWLIKGALCDLLVYKLLKTYKLWNIKYKV
jgi:ribosomal protein S16